MRASLRSQVYISAERRCVQPVDSSNQETCEKRAQVALVLSILRLCATVKCADCVKSKARKPSGFEDWPEGFRYLCGR